MKPTVNEERCYEKHKRRQLYLAVLAETTTITNRNIQTFLEKNWKKYTVTANKEISIDSFDSLALKFEQNKKA